LTGFETQIRTKISSSRKIKEVLYGRKQKMAGNFGDELCVKMGWDDRRPMRRYFKEVER
jgi:hypothetical protein